MGQAADKARVMRERIRGNFDRGAGDYGRFEARTAFFRELLAALLELGPPLRGRRVLDVGCGTGASAAGLLEAVGPEGRVIGIDISLGMLREARERLAGRAGLALMDGCGFGRGLRAVFDAVVYNAVSFILPDARASLEAAWEVLAPGGAVLVSHLDGVVLPDAGRSVPELLAERGLPAGRHALSPWPRVLEALRELGGDPAVRTRRVRLPAERFLAFYGMEPMSAGLLPTLPYSERRRVVEELAAELGREGRHAEQVWHLACARRSP